ncbi:hypothetical protein [Novosphingobium sp.]|uniref:hypothetical protein n=1 Tax=Novosphingobium sp. TaxID=1874826 RepID=UPI0025DD15E9|nr:hypothetical protein [Novosphingobium sp.]
MATAHVVAPMAAIMLGVIAATVHIAVLAAHVMTGVPHFAAIAAHVVAVCHAFAAIMVHVTRLGVHGRAIAVHVLAHCVAIVLHAVLGVHLGHCRRCGYGKCRQDGGHQELFHRENPLALRL